jgi:DUF971 family protein
MSEIGFFPTHLSKDESSRELVIQWSDDVTQRLKYRALRDRCPCAHCIDKRTKGDTNESITSDGMLNVLSAAELQPLDIASMKPIGNYAYGIQFTDGHSSGIFSFGFLRSLGSSDADSSAELN